MKTTILKSWQQLSQLEPEWDKLLESSRSNTLFLTWEWIQSWRRVVGDDIELFVITVRDDSARLVGVAPLFRYRLKLFNLITYKALRILADHSTGFEYADWFVDPNCESEALTAITDCLLRSTDLWDLIWMPKMSGWQGALERITQTLNRSKLMFRSRTTPFSVSPLPTSMDEFERSFSSKHRKNLRRARRNLLSTPGVEIIHCRDMDEIPRFVDALFDLHHKRRLLLGDSGCFVRKPTEAAFYRQFIPIAWAKGWLRFSALAQDGQIKAIQIGYVYNQTFFALQEGFDPDYTEGAGNVLRHVIIEQCIEEGLKDYDFLGGFTEHKRRWGALRRDGHDLLIAHPSPKNKLLFLNEVWPTGRYIKEHGLFYSRPA